METVWTFETANYKIALEIAPEEMDPADQFSEEADIEAIRCGRVAWFCARVSVYKNGHRVGCDTLGGCAYYKVSDFYTDHRDSDPLNRNCSIMRKARGDNVSICHYFPSMISEAIADARKTIGA